MLDSPSVGKEIGERGTQLTMHSTEKLFTQSNFRCDSSHDDLLYCLTKEKRLESKNSVNEDLGILFTKINDTTPIEHIFKEKLMICDKSLLKQRYLNHYTKQKYSNNQDYVVEIVDVFDGIKPITGINNVIDSATAHASHGFISLSTKSDDNPYTTETLHENVVKQLKNIDTEDIIKKEDVTHLIQPPYCIHFYTKNDNGSIYHAPYTAYFNHDLLLACYFLKTFPESNISNFTDKIINKETYSIDESDLKSISIYACNLFWITLLDHIKADYESSLSSSSCYVKDDIFNKAIEYLKKIQFVNISFYKQSKFNTFPETLMATLPQTPNKKFPFNLSKETCASILIGAHEDDSGSSGSKSATDFLTALKSDATKWLKNNPAPRVDENNFLIFIGRILKYSGDTSHLHMAICVYHAYNKMIETKSNLTNNLTINLYLSERPLGYRACVLQQYYPELKKKLNVIINDVAVYNQLMDHELKNDNNKDIKKICYILPANDIKKTYESNCREFIKILQYIKRIQYTEKEVHYTDFLKKVKGKITIDDKLITIDDKLEENLQLSDNADYNKNNNAIEGILSIIKNDILFTHIEYDKLKNEYNSWIKSIVIHPDGVKMSKKVPSQKFKVSSRQGLSVDRRKEPKSIFLLEAKKKCSELLFENNKKQKDLIYNLEILTNIEKIICKFNLYKSKFEALKDKAIKYQDDTLETEIKSVQNDIDKQLKEYIKKNYTQTIINTNNHLQVLFKELIICLYDKVMIHYYFTNYPTQDRYKEEEIKILFHEDHLDTLYSFIEDILFDILNATKEEETYSIKNNIKLKFISFFILLLKQKNNDMWIKDIASVRGLTRDIDDDLQFIISKDFLKEKLIQIVKADQINKEVKRVFVESKDSNYQSILIQEVKLENVSLKQFLENKDKSGIIEEYKNMLHTTFASGIDLSVYSGGGKRRTHKNKSYIKSDLSNIPLNKTFKNRSRFKNLSNRQTYEGGTVLEPRFQRQPQQQSQQSLLTQQRQVQNMVTDDTKKVIGLMYIPSDNPFIISCQRKLKMLTIQFNYKNENKSSYNKNENKSSYLLFSWYNYLILLNKINRTDVNKQSLIQNIQKTNDYKIYKKYNLLIDDFIDDNIIINDSNIEEYVDIVSFLNDRIFNYEEYIASCLLKLYDNTDKDKIDDIESNTIKQFRHIFTGGDHKIRKSHKKYISNHKYTQKKYKGGVNAFSYIIPSKQKENNEEMIIRYFKLLYDYRWDDDNDKMIKNLLINKDYLNYLNNRDNLIYLFDSYTLLTTYIDYMLDKPEKNIPKYSELASFGSEVSPYIIENLIYILNYLKNTIHVNSFFTSLFNDEYNTVITNLKLLL